MSAPDPLFDRWAKCRQCGGTFPTNYFERRPPYAMYPFPCPFCYAEPSLHDAVEGPDDMGDHRATITIKMHLHKKDYESAEWWINYWPNDDGIDQRIVDWFRGCWEDAYDRYRMETLEEEEKNRKRIEREHELAELARLKTKYPDTPTEGTP